MISSSPRPPLVAIAGIAAVLAAGLVADHLVGGSGQAAANTGVSPAIGALAPRGALSSTWYCPGLGATPDSPMRGRVIVANPSGNDIHATATFVPSSGPKVARDATIPAFGRTTFKLEEQAPAAFTATMVSIDGDVGAVEQEIQGPSGESISACTGTSSDHWYFASGRTDTGATMLVSMYNPFPADAIVDLRFATDQGPTTPDAYQGLVVPGGGQMVLNIGERVRLRSAIATNISVRSGRLVVDKLQSQNGSAAQGSTPFHGLSVILGSTAPGSTWYFADGVKAPGITEHFDLYNPGPTEAHVELAATLEQGSADPFELTVPPGDRATLQVDKESRIPASVGQAWVATAANGVPFVVERVYEEQSPAPHQGVADSLGSPRLSTRWVFPAGSAGSGADEYLVVFNPGRRAANVTVAASGLGHAQLLPGLNPLVLAPSSRQAIRISNLDHDGVVVLDVRADAPFLAERAQSRLSGNGLSGSIGIGDGVGAVRSAANG